MRTSFTPPEAYQVLFVCLGNICRSSTAEIVFSHLLEEANLSQRIFCDSAGTLDYHQGKPPDYNVQKILRSRGYPIIGTSRSLMEDDFLEFDLIIGMDSQNYKDICQLRESSPALAKRRLKLSEIFVNKLLKMALPTLMEAIRNSFFIVLI